MKLIFIICTILITVAFINRLIFYLRFRYRLKKKKFDLIKLKGFSNNTWIHFIGGIVSIGAGFVFYTIYNYDFVLEIWIILGLISIIHCFIAPHDYLLMNNNGITNTYGKKLIEWEMINDIDLNSDNNQEFSIITDKKLVLIDYGEKEFLDKILNMIKEKRIDIYNKFFSDFN